MADNRLKMLTPERMALLTLAIALMVWALVLIIRDDDPIDEPATVATEQVVTDTITLAPTKAKRRTAPRGKKTKVPKPPVHHRDHLNEPLDTE